MIIAGLILIGFHIFLAHSEEEFILKEYIMNGSLEEVIDSEERPVYWNSYEETGGKYLGDLLPKNWLFQIHNASPAITMGIDSNIKHSGKYSIKIINGCEKDIGVIQNIDLIEIKPDTVYIFSCYVKGENVSGKGGVTACVSFASKAGGFWADPNRITVWFDKSLSGTFDWKKIEIKFSTNSESEIMLIGGQFRHASGLAWFDDFSLVEYYGG